MISNGSKPRLLFILGMHRSGTSALVRTLNLMGWQLPKNLLAANQDNPFGYWEPKSVVDFNNRVLQCVDRHWADPKPLPANWMAGLPIDLDANAAAEVLRSELYGAGELAARRGLVIKDPRLSLTFPLWLDASEQCGFEPTCLIVCRNPLEVYRSLQSRDQLTRDHALQLWLSNMLEAERTTRGIPRGVINYDDLLADWRKALVPALEAINWTELQSSDEISRQIDMFLSPDQRHHRVKGINGFHDTAIESDVRIAYEIFLDSCSPSSFEQLDAIAQRYAEGWVVQSPGDQSSGFAQRLPAWQAEHSWSEFAKGNLSSAIEAARSAVDGAPKTMRFHYILGHHLFRIGQFEEALECFQHALKLGSSEMRVFRAASETLVALGRLDAAIDMAQQIVDSPASTVRDELFLADIQLRTKRAQEAIAILSRALCRRPKNASLHGKLSLAHVQAGEPTEALYSAQRAVALDPDNLASAKQLAVLLKQNERGGEANLILELPDKPVLDQADQFDEMAQNAAVFGDWLWASQAFSAAQTLRKEKLFDAEDTDAASGRIALMKLLARTTTRYWVDDLIARVQSIGSTSAASRAWPSGPLLPAMERGLNFNNPKVQSEFSLSVMLPVYEVDRPDWLAGALTSVLEQVEDVDQTEIVIVDDASKSEVAMEVAERFGERVRYCRNTENLGLVGNHNKCIREARGEFVHILHQDDRVKPGLYKALLAPLQADPSLVAAFCQIGYIADDDRPENVESSLQARGKLIDWAMKLSLYRIQFPSMIVRRTSYIAAGGFSPTFKFAFDWDMWNRLCASGPVWYEPTALAQYRVHNRSATHSFGLVARVKEAMQVVANMVQRVPAHKRRTIAELALYKFILRYWSLIDPEQSKSRVDPHFELKQFLLEGWAEGPAQGEWLSVFDRYS